MRKRSRKRGVLSTNDKINITHRVLVDFEKQAEVAKDFRVTPQVVASIIFKAKRNKKFLEELLVKDGNKEELRKRIKSRVEILNNERSIIDSAKMIVQRFDNGADKPPSEMIV